MDISSPNQQSRADVSVDAVNSSDNVFTVAGRSVSVSSLYAHVDEDRLRRRMKYFFMNPCQKWAAKRKMPWKLLVQFLKVLIVTVQLVQFGLSRSAHIDYLEKTNIALKHLYLKDWNPSYETMPYPPSTGAFAVYMYDDFYSSISFALTQYNKTEDIAIGTFSFVSENNTITPPQMCLRYYRNGQIFAFNESFIFDPNDIAYDCFDLLPIDGKYNVEAYLASVNQSINFDGLIDAKLLFSLKTVHLKSLSGLDYPDCYKFDIEIVYDNQDHSGQMTVALRSKEIYLPCKGTVLYLESDHWAKSRAIVFDVFVMLVCFASMVMCLRSLYRALLLMKIAVGYFATAPNKEPLKFSERMEFINFWYIMIVINDILSISGCIAKLLIETKVNAGYEVCGVLLGTANLLVWCGVLRYLGFYENYNILLRTIKRSFPSIARFLLCSVIFYFGFVICGWVVLGPYHLKFRYISTASECLFSLMNGDDIFTTFAAMVDVNTVIWWYSRAYLYIFVSLFIYVILSVFIAVIMDTYENIKKEADRGITKTRLEEFADECSDEPHQLFADQQVTCPFSCCAVCIAALCCHRRPKIVAINGEDVPNEYTALVR